jgi:hypothetical protein
MTPAALSPFNIDLLVLKDSDIKLLRQIKVLDIFDGFSNNFHQDGLFSIDIFGKPGEEKRNRLYAYIDLRVSVFHPVVYKAICELKEMYGEIIAGKTYAIFDTATKDFIKADILTGDTGFHFFTKHFGEIKFETRPSSKREFNIKLIEKYKENCLLEKLVVMPAGLRDYTVDENNKPSEDEINNLYRKLISVSSVIENVNAKNNLEYLDSARYSLQLGVMAIYDYIKNLLEGKSKLILGKWASRKIFNSTRNVITSYIPDSTELFGPRTVSYNQTVVGMYQYLRCILPLAVKQIRDTYLSDVFLGPSSPAVLVNKKTLTKEMVQLNPEYYDEWMTYEGLEKTMARFGEENLRHEVLEIEDYYLGLMYKGPDKTYRFLQDITELPEGRNKEDVKPITFAELLYISVFQGSSDIPCFFTRYPIAGYGSIYPGYCYLKTTVKSEQRELLNDNWELSGIIANEFPKSDEFFYNSMSPHVGHIARLDADAL